jgi:hypothetical protein
MVGKWKGKKSAAASIGSKADAHSEAPLMLEPERPGEYADRNSRGFKAVINMEKKEEEQEKEDVSEVSFKAMGQPGSVIESGPLPSLPANESVSDGLEEPPRTIDENSSSIWHTLSTWWKKDKRKKHTINWAEIEIDVCPPPDFVEEPWQLSSPDFIEEPRQASSPENHEPELEAPPIPINDYSWFTLPTWWRKARREKRALAPADIDACPPPGCIEESGMFWSPGHESDLPTTEASNGTLETEGRGVSGRNV